VIIHQILATTSRKYDFEDWGEASFLKKVGGHDANNTDDDDDDEDVCTHSSFFSLTLLIYLLLH